MAFLILVVNSSLMSLCPSPLKSSRPTVLTASLAGALTRHSATGNTTATRSSGGVCWPARRGPFRTTQVRAPSWLHVWYIFRYQGRVLTAVTLLMMRNTRSIHSCFLFSGIVKDSFLTGKRLGARRRILIESGYWLAFLKSKWARMGEQHQVDIRYIQWTQTHYSFSKPLPRTTWTIFSRRE